MFDDKRSKTFTDAQGNETTLNIVLLPASKGVPLMTKLSSVLGNLFAAEVTSIPLAIAQVANKIDFFDVAKVLFAGAVVNNEKTSFEDMPLNVDKFFTGNYGQLLDMVAFALEANFGSFFESTLMASKTQQ